MAKIPTVKGETNPKLRRYAQISGRSLNFEIERLRGCVIRATDRIRLRTGSKQRIIVSFLSFQIDDGRRQRPEEATEVNILGRKTAAQVPEGSEGSEGPEPRLQDPSPPQG